MARTKMNDEESVRIKQLVGEILKEQREIDQYEGDVIACHIRLGTCLAELRPLAKRTWGKQLKFIGINPRVASRYLKIAQNWQPEFGLNESDLLPRLPADLLKLEWLCRVPLPQLRELLNDLDCKKASRSQVIAAVREALGEDPPAKDEVDDFVRRFINRLVGTVGRLDERFPEPEQQNRARELLRNGLCRVQETLQAGGPCKKWPCSDGERFRIHRSISD